MENSIEAKRKVLKKLHQAMMGGDLQPLLNIRISAGDPSSAVREGEMEEPGEERDEMAMDPNSAVREGEMESPAGDPELAELIRRKKRERGEY
jgi:hypothetical protein